jgi:ParB family chromosome partitioning protein
VAQQAAARADSPYQTVGIERIHPRPTSPASASTSAPCKSSPTASASRGSSSRSSCGAGRTPRRRYEIIAGERRWRAAQRAGLREVPVVVRETTPDAAFELALVENLQRQDLDPVETATAYKRLLEDHGYTQEELAARIGKDRSTIANTLRLLQLPGDVLTHVVARELSEGHARALLSAAEPQEIVRLARHAVEKGWSVRQTEAAARKPRRLEGPASPAKAPSAAEGAAAKSPNLRDLERRLEAALGLPVAIRAEGGTSGTVEIAFDSLDQLDSFLDKVLGR